MSNFFTYFIKHIPTNTFYYGACYSMKRTTQDFWVRYFSSSKEVAALIEEYGEDSFTYEIRRTFKTAELALEWEKKVLRRMKVHLRSDFLNKNPGRGYGFAVGKKHWAYGKTYTEEHRENNKIGQKNSPAWSKTPKDHPSRKLLGELAKTRFTGSKASEETKRKMSEGRTGENNGMYGKTFSEEVLLQKSIFMKELASNEDFVGSKNLVNSTKERMLNGTHTSQIITKCEHCGLEVKAYGNYIRWHGVNCKVLKQKENTLQDFLL